MTRVQDRGEEDRADVNPGARGVTFLELLAVVLILGILTTIATNVYTGQVSRAKVVATADLIRELETAITRYEIDTGTFPPSGSGSSLGGSAFLYEALVHSIGGDVFSPSSVTWQGPYIEFHERTISNRPVLIPTDGFPGLSGPGRTQNGTSFFILFPPQILDAFGQPIHYTSETSYQFRGCELFDGARPPDTQPHLPANNPFFATETHYNPVTFQLFSGGTNFGTLRVSSTSQASRFPGAEFDDINNY